MLVSAVTAWEISIKQTLGRLEFPLDRFDDILQQIGFDPLPVLPGRRHNDPFDRMLIAQALTGGLTLVSYDNAVCRYPVPVLR